MSPFTLFRAGSSPANAGFRFHREGRSLKVAATILIFTLGCAEKVEIIPSAEVVPFKPKDIGEIGGLVYETDGKTPISGVMVLAYDKYGYATSYGQTDVYGRYTIRNLPFGEYILQIRSGELYGTAQKYAGEYYKNAYNWRDVGVVSVKTTEPISFVNFLLEKGGVFRGKLIDASQKEPLTNTPFFLMAYKSEHSYVTYLSYTDSLGEYLITGLEPGGYKIKIEPEGWIGGFYGVDSWDSAWVVESKLDTVILADFETREGGAISGKVNSFVPGVMIQVIGEKKLLQKSVDSVGDFVLSGLPDGQYLVKVSPPRGSPYAWEYYPTPIKVDMGDTISGINFELTDEGVISGTVKAKSGLPIEEFDIDIYSANVGALNLTPLLSGGEIHFSGGEYEIRGLPEGEYILRINSFSPRTLKSYISEYFVVGARLPRPYFFKDATPIKVRSGYNTSGINFTLKKAGWIEGFVLLNNELLSSEDIKFEIIAFNVNSGEVSVSQNTFCGGYRISGLGHGEYKLCAFSPNSEFAGIWIGGGRRFDDPKNIVIKIEESSPTNVNFSVALGSCQIGGKVCDVLTGISIFGELIAYDSTGHIVQVAGSNDEGYTLQGLAPGKYFIRTYKFGNYQDKWYRDYAVTGVDVGESRRLAPTYISEIPFQASEVEVKEDTLLTGIDFELHPIK